MWCSRLIGGGNTHQTKHPARPIGARGGEQGWQAFDADAAFLRFVAGIDLNQ